MHHHTNQNRNHTQLLHNARLPLRPPQQISDTRPEKYRTERVATISPRILPQKENTLLDVASLWDPNSHQQRQRPKDRSYRHEVQEYDNVPIQKLHRRDSKSRSPTTIPKVGARVVKAPKANEDFCCEETIIVKQASSKKIETLKDVTATVKPSFFHKGLNEWEVEIAQFEALEQQINGEQQAAQLVYLSGQQHVYLANPHYLKKQNKLDWQSRAILMEWLMQIHTEFLLKRHTFHLSISIVDLYLSKAASCVSKKDLQAIGSVAMYIASKIEEEQPVSIVKIGKCSMDKYSSDTLLQIQQLIIKALGWNLCPPTTDMWANRVMQQWDLFIQSPISSHLFSDFRNTTHMLFKQQDQKSYKNYREMMQLVDCSVVDIESLQYKPRLLVCSFMYLLLGKHYANFNGKQISRQFPFSSLYLISDQVLFNSVYSKFLEFTFGLPLLDLLPTVQYCATFFGLPFNYDVPCIDVESDRISAQEYVTYQTYNPYTMHTIRHKHRNIAQ